MREHKIDSIHKIAIAAIDYMMLVSRRLVASMVASMALVSERLTREAVTMALVSKSWPARWLAWHWSARAGQQGG